MTETIYNFKYKKIKNFLTEDEIILLKNYCIIRHRLNNNFLGDAQVGDDASYYADPLIEGLLLSKHKKIETLTGVELYPTYSYYRMYTYLAELKKHKDRPSCEISVSVNIDSCGKSWPIFMEGNEIHLEKGEAVIYLGQKVEHWRNEFDGDYCCQAFLHYVNKNGENKEWLTDKRKLWGQCK